MTRPLRTGILVVLVVVGLSVVPVHTWNPLVHIYVAQRVYPLTFPKADLYYGALAPDIAWYIPTYGTAIGAETHVLDSYVALQPLARSWAQKAFVRGWWTHNEDARRPGADYDAHVNPGYVVGRASALAADVGISEDLAHFAIETAVDLLLKEDQPILPTLLLEAVICRSDDDAALMRTLPGYGGALVEGEEFFRQLTFNYAMALALPAPADLAALSRLGVQVAAAMGVTITPVQAAQILTAAKAYCADYKPVVELAISRMRPVAPRF